ncbi:MAG TPA: type II toxin-antitoxin system RelE/ParE family toxin [Bryobacteraceae bacterium]|nr:type II toxin-antitoxin system RelE/ParE family toxin [Bryobacteraceae bacterium]
MRGFLLSERAERDLDEAWFYIARESGSTDVATRVVDDIYRRFWFLAENPYGGRGRDEDLRPELRSFPADQYTVIYRVGKNDEDAAVYILHVIHSSRDLPGVIGERSE